jgi:tetratricopeptide (TPR) repeat protein
MRDDEEDIDLIEAYLKGTLDEQALAAFQKRRQEDADFDREVIDYSQIISGIRISQERDFMSKLRHWEGEIENRQEAKVISLRTMFSIAASVVLVSLVGVYLFRSGQSDHEQLFQEYFQPYENVISERTGKNDHQQRGMELYDQRKYDDAIAELKVAAIEDPDNSLLKCYLGIAYLAEDHAQEAKAIFGSMVPGDQSLTKEVAEWYLAMAYLKLDDEPSLKKTLEDILHQKDHLYREQAKELLKSI